MALYKILFSTRVGITLQQNTHNTFQDAFDFMSSQYLHFTLFSANQAKFIKCMLCLSFTVNITVTNKWVTFSESSRNHSNMNANSHPQDCPALHDLFDPVNQTKQISSTGKLWRLRNAHNSTCILICGRFVNFLCAIIPPHALAFEPWCSFHFFYDVERHCEQLADVFILDLENEDQTVCKVMLVNMGWG